MHLAVSKTGQGDAAHLIPTVHEGPIAPVDQLSGTGRIYLVQIGPHDPSYSLNDFAEWLHSKYALDVRVVPPIAFDPSAWNIWRGQIAAEMVFEYLKRKHPTLQTTRARMW